ncbi:unnamed protein product, partial [Mesorhabditis belari]|uniref:Uncharacterized protein n=1 Tax=Mesorhabditis belari TaxID=2138241 RepID=A0AAF3EM04_9BILA
MPDPLFPAEGAAVLGVASYLGETGARMAMIGTGFFMMSIFISINDCVHARSLLLHGKHQLVATLVKPHIELHDGKWYQIGFVFGGDEIDIDYNTKVSGFKRRFGKDLCAHWNYAAEWLYFTIPPRFPHAKGCSSSSRPVQILVGLETIGVTHGKDVYIFVKAQFECKWTVMDPDLRRR